MVLLLSNAVSIPGAASSAFGIFNLEYGFACLWKSSYFGRLWQRLALAPVLIVLLEMLYLLERFALPLMGKTVSGVSSNSQGGLWKYSNLSTKKRHRYVQAVFSVLIFTYTPTMKV